MSSSLFQGLLEGWEVLEGWSGRLGIEVGPKCQALPLYFMVQVEETAHWRRK